MKKLESMKEVASALESKENALVAATTKVRVGSLGAAWGPRLGGSLGPGWGPGWGARLGGQAGG